MPIQLVDPARQVADARATLLSLVTFGDLHKGDAQKLEEAIDVLEDIQREGESAWT